MSLDHLTSSAPSSTGLVLELRSLLKRQLPDHMIPAAFVILEDVPLLPNGKVDYGALPDPDVGQPPTSTAFVAPETPLQQRLARIWAQTLRLDQVGIHDNFFELGGDSILGLQIVARAHQAGIDLPVRSLFEAPTIAALAELIEVVHGAVQGDAARHDTSDGREQGEL